MQALLIILKSKNWLALKESIGETTWTKDLVASEFDNLLKQHCTASTEASTLKQQQEKIDLHFNYDTIEEIVSSLKSEASQGDKWAEETMNTLLSKSPTSLKVSLNS